MNNRQGAPALLRWLREADGTLTAYTGTAYNPQTVMGDVEFGGIVWRSPADGSWVSRTTTANGLLLEELRHDSLAKAKAAVEAAYYATSV